MSNLARPTIIVDLRNQEFTYGESSPHSLHNSLYWGRAIPQTNEVNILHLKYTMNDQDLPGEIDRLREYLQDVAGYGGSAMHSPIRETGEIEEDSQKKLLHLACEASIQLITN
ncbi:hypothetical protein CMI38_03270 [Candidatus Pacearchaeota archaeon]|jgi:hypothetical protein|nr:hypothetical protein [Candidatus Pacearchaeota archaeon]|tara:strand:+ start:9426 stop:9764 length:339 start_codon:yes stop_codon:yes gene_type:complete